MGRCLKQYVEEERYIALQPGDHGHEMQFSRGPASDLEEHRNGISFS
jgi:hypothetical protein